jgi:CheY-like chemotaxis protein
MLDDADKEIDENTVSITKIDWSGKSILIVEDTPSNFYLIENYLRATGIKIFWAKSGKEALDLFKTEHNFDAVLMDIQLPGINGYEATKLIKAHNKNVPVIAQTAYALAGEREHSFSEGCDDYIAKPIKKESLLELINKHLER